MLLSIWRRVPSVYITETQIKIADAFVQLQSSGLFSFAVTLEELQTCVMGLNSRLAGVLGLPSDSSPSPDQALTYARAVRQASSLLGLRLPSQSGLSDHEMQLHMTQLQELGPVTGLSGRSSEQADFPVVFKWELLALQVALNMAIAWLRGWHRKDIRTGSCKKLTELLQPLQLGAERVSPLEWLVLQCVIEVRGKTLDGDSGREARVLFVQEVRGIAAEAQSQQNRQVHGSCIATALSDRSTKWRTNVA